MMNKKPKILEKIAKGFQISPISSFGFAFSSLASLLYVPCSVICLFSEKTLPYSRVLFIESTIFVVTAAINRYGQKKDMSKYEEYRDYFKSKGWNQEYFEHEASGMQNFYNFRDNLLEILGIDSPLKQAAKDAGHGTELKKYLQSLEVEKLRNEIIWAGSTNRRKTISI